MVCRWAIGLTFSVVFGGLVVWVFLSVLRYCLRLDPKSPPGNEPKKWTWQNGVLRPPKQSVGVPGWLTGGVERLVFTILVGFDAGISTASMATAMLAWLALKMASNWNRADQTAPTTRRYAFTALLAGLLSMLFAFYGGWICAGLRPIPDFLHYLFLQCLAVLSCPAGRWLIYP